MRDPRYYITNPFNSPNISIDELVSFTTDHLKRLGTHNGSGDWSSRIAPTSTAMANFEDSINSDFVKAALRKSRKESKDNYRKITVRGEVEKIVAVAVAHFGSNAAEITQIIPNGRSIFTNCKDDKLMNHLNQLKEGVTAYQAQLGGAVVAEATTLLNEWLEIYDASENSTAAKAMTEEEQRGARIALQKELFLNLLEIARRYPDQPEILGSFMQPSLAGGPPLSGGSPGGGGDNGGGGSSSDSSADSSGSSAQGSSSSNSSQPSESSASSNSSGSSLSSISSSSSNSSPSSSSSYSSSSSGSSI